MSTIFRHSTLFLAIVVFCMSSMEPETATARWWPCLCRKCVFSVDRLGKSRTFWDAYKSWTLCSNVVQTQMKEYGYTLFSFFFFENIVSLLIGLSFFVTASGFKLKFSRDALLSKRLQLYSKTALTTNGFILDCICWNMPRFVVALSAWTKICKICSFVFLFSRLEVFSMYSLRGILVCSWNVPLLFSHRIFYYQSMSCFNAV